MPPGVSSSCRCSSAVVPELKKCSGSPRLGQGGHHPVAGADERPRALHDLLEDVVELEGLVDAEAGLAQPGQAVPRGLALGAGSVGLVHMSGLICNRSWCPDGPVRRNGSLREIPGESGAISPDYTLS